MSEPAKRSASDRLRPRLRVAVVAPQAASRGSVAAIVREQVALLGSRFDVTLISGSIPDETRGGRSIAVGLPTFRALHRFGHAPREWAAGRALARATVELAESAGLDVAIFHAHTVAAIAAGECRRRGIGTVLFAHSDIRLRPAGAYDPVQTLLYRWSNPAAYRRVERVVALSRDFAEIARSNARAEQVLELPCPVSGPWPVTQRRAAVVPGSALRVGFVGRLAVEKGVSVLLEAFRRWLELRPATHLKIAGDGRLRLDLESSARALGASVEFVGWKRGAELERFYRELDLFCLPSISENQGVASQEALLRGIPVVAARVGGLAETVRPGLDGELCEPGSADSLLAALERAAQQLEGRGYDVPDPVWMERYSPQSHLEAVSSLIEELAS